MPKTPEKMSEIMKRMAESVLLDPGNESGEAFQAALLLSHVAWNRCLGSDRGTQQYRSILSEMEMENPELWGELVEPDAEALIRSLMAFKNQHYPDDRRNLVVCGMREESVHTEWIDPADVVAPSELIRTLLVHILKGNTEEAVSLYAKAANVDMNMAREKVAEIEALNRQHGMDTFGAESADFLAESIVGLLDQDGFEAPYNLIDLPPEQVVPERTFALAGIMDELDRNKGYFPRDAVAAAIDDPELVTPALLQSIRHATDESKRLVDEESAYMAHLYAMYILAQFREKRAYPLIAAFASLPGELTHDLAGDFVTEDLGRVLASVCGGDQSLIRELIEGEAVNEYVRGQAMHALLCLVASGQAERDDVLAYFGKLLRTDFARRPSHALDELVLYAAHLCPGEIIDDIRAAYEGGVVNYGYISLKSIEKRLNAGREATMRLLADSPMYSFIDDTIKEMAWWACFREEDEEFDEPDFDGSPLFSGSDWEPSPEPIRREGPKIGRNEPCPCGSGRKFKKCCGR